MGFRGTVGFIFGIAIAAFFLRLVACSDNLSDEEARDKARQIFKRGTDVTIGAGEGALEALSDEAKKLNKRYGITGDRDDGDFMKNLDKTINDDLSHD